MTHLLVLPHAVGCPPAHATGITLERCWSGGVRAWPVALAAGPGLLACYLQTLGRYVYSADPAEFQMLARTGGIAHAGHPAWSLLSRLASALALTVTMWNESPPAGVHAPTLALDVVLLLLALRCGWRPSAVLATAAAVVLGLARFGCTTAMDRPEQSMNYLRDMPEPGETSFAVDRPDVVQRGEHPVWFLSGNQCLAADRRSLPVLLHRAGYLASVLVFNELPFGVMLIALAGFVLLLRAPWEPRWLGWIATAAVLVMPVPRPCIVEPPALLARHALLRHVWEVSPNGWSPFRHDRRFDDYGRGVMQRLPPRAVVLGARWDEPETLRYFVFGEPLRPDVEVLYAGAASSRLAPVAGGRCRGMPGLPELRSPRGRTARRALGAGLGLGLATAVANRNATIG